MLYIYLALISAICFSTSDICSKYLFNNSISNLQYLFWAHGILYIILSVLTILVCSYLSIGLFTNNKTYLDVIKFPKLFKNRLVLIFGTVSSFIGLLVLMYSFKISKNIGYTVGLVGTTSLFTLILSSLIFKKSINPFGLLGVILIISGVFFISKCEN